MRMKRIGSMLLAALLCASLAACATQTGDSSAPGGQSGTGTAPADGYTPGTYEATAFGMKSNITVQVTVDEASIVSVEVVEHNDTRVIADTAIDTITAEIVSGQTLAVDTVAGATLTSGAILSAASDALVQAGGDMEALKASVDKQPLEAGDTEQVDIIIVGAGGSGLSAAIQATRDSDLNVVVVDKLAYIGGSTRVAGGAIWMNGTPYNEEAGIDYDGEYLIEFMESRSDRELNRPLLRKIAEITPDTMAYLMDKGMPLDTSNTRLGHPDSKLFMLSPPDSGSGNGGAQVSDFLAEVAVDNGVDLRLNTKAVSLVIQDGAVVGVELEDGQKQYTVNASKVILATGGFTRNEEMIKELAPEFTNNIPFTGAGSDGDGITMTRELNVSIVGDGMMGLKTLNHNYGYYYTIGSLVNHPSVFFNKEGARFANEKVFYSEITYPLNQQTDKRVFGIVDSQSDLTEPLDEAVELGLVYKTDTLEELADATGMDKEAFLAGIQEYNDVKASGEDDPAFGVSNEQMVSITEAPFYAVPIRPGFIGSIPGLETNEDCEVLTQDGAVVPNLYACGELIFGNVFSKWYPASGTGVGTAVYTGAIAGTAAKEALLGNPSTDDVADEIGEEPVETQEEPVEVDEPVEVEELLEYEAGEEESAA